jgi:putative CocE/NonD family hydrolase
MYSVKMPDGVLLSAAVWRPDVEGERFPVIMLSTPYNKIGERSVEQGEYFAHRGYAYVAYDKRGRYDSEGLANRYGPDDGADLSAMQTWAGTQPWSTGKVATLGGSASGMVQWLAALHRNPHLAAIMPEVAPDDHHYNSFPGGAYQLSTNIAALVGSSGMRTNTPPGSIDFEKWYRYLPLKDSPDFVGIKNDHIWRWEVANPYLNDKWPQIGQQLGPGRAGPGKYEHIKVPSFNLTGWYDQTSLAVISSFVSMVKFGPPDLRKTHKLFVGPWTHSALFSVRQGQLTLPNQAAPNGLEWRLRWFDQWLKGIDTGLNDEPPIYLYVMGADVWRNECEWPLQRTQYVDYYLHSTRGANTRLGDGILTTTPPKNEDPDRFVYDPSDPVPTLGGNVSMRPPAVGPYDQRAIQLRNDVLVYTTPPLEEDIEVTGPVVLKLFASTDGRDTDFTGKLIDVHPDGYAQILLEGVIRGRYWKGFTEENLLTPNQSYEFYIDLWSTSNTFRKGHRIQVEVSSSNFPKYDRNPNTGHKFGEDAQLRVAQQTVYHDETRPSRLILPVIPLGSKPCSTVSQRSDVQ